LNLILLSYLKATRTSETLSSLRTASKNLLNSSLLVFVVAMTMTVPMASAYVYSGYDKTRVVVLWFETQRWELWVKIDTARDTWNVKYKKSGGWPYTYLMYAWPISKVKVWDNKGFSYTLQPHPESGEFTLTYLNTNTWTHTEVVWPYATTPFTYDYKKCRVDIYVGA
jgi:hypothetical protein